MHTYKLLLCYCIIHYLTGCTHNNIYIPTDGRDSVVYVAGSGCTINMDAARVQHGDTIEQYQADFDYCMAQHMLLNPGIK